MNHRRKIKPTHVERAYWGEGQAESLKSVVPSPFGRIGGLNCFEHTQPLLRYYQYAQNLDIHCAGWPHMWGEPLAYHFRRTAANRFSQVMAMEGACFVLTCTQVLSEKSKTRVGLGHLDWINVPGGGFTMIYGPDGSELSEPMDPGTEGIAYAEIDLADRNKAKATLDLVGHYSRPDLLSLQVTECAATQVHFK